mgnify:CR=1 FL=1|jgi:hypothetical protein
MASLEILDLSKNQIESFPETPGRLTKLKVLSLTRNKIYALPSYLTDFASLKVFKVDQNPIEWPPREVLGALVDGGYSQRDPETGVSKRDEDMRPWIENMKSWMRQRASEGDSLVVSNREEDSYLASECVVSITPKLPLIPQRRTSQRGVSRRPERGHGALGDGFTDILQCSSCHTDGPASARRIHSRRVAFCSSSRAWNTQSCSDNVRRITEPSCLAKSRAPATPFCAPRQVTLKLVIHPSSFCFDGVFGPFSCAIGESTSASTRQYRRT